jgi:hypothetical protein
MEDTEASLGEESAQSHDDDEDQDQDLQALGADDFFDMDEFAAMAAEIEEEEALRRAAQRSPMKSERRSTGSPKKPHLNAEGDEWEIRDAPSVPSPRRVIGPSNGIFNFAARQADAQQIDFESLSAGRRSTSVTPSVPRTAATRFTPTQRHPSVSRRTPSLGSSGFANTPVQRATSNHIPRRSVDALPIPTVVKKQYISPASVHSSRFEDTPRASHPRHIHAPSATPRSRLSAPPIRGAQPANRFDEGSQAFVPRRSIFDDGETDVEAQRGGHRRVRVDRTDVAEMSAEPGIPLDQFEDILPDTLQLAGLTSSRDVRLRDLSDEFRTPGQVDLDFEDMLPDTLQRGGRYAVGMESQGFDLGEVDTDNVNPELNDMLVVPHLELGVEPVAATQVEVQFVEDYDPPIEPELPALPVSQLAYISNRPRHSWTEGDFAIPEPEEDAEDRQLLRSSPPVDRGEEGRIASHAEVESEEEVFVPVQRPVLVSQRPSSVNPEPIRRPISTPAVNGTPPPRESTSVVPSSRAPASGRRGREFTIDEIDPYLVDVDGERLRPDPTYVLPPNYKGHPSYLHGKVGGQLSTYSRLSGRHRWSKTEEILLYRTVQKVPMSEEYPLQVVWYLHGEHGVLSNDLEMFNPQHMKDKMRVIVTARENNGRLVDARARFWLRSEHPDKVEYLTELERVRKRKQAVEAERMRQEALRRAQEAAAEKQRREREAAAEARKKKKNRVEDEEEDEVEEDEVDEDEEEGEDEDEDEDEDDEVSMTDH